MKFTKKEQNVLKALSNLKQPTATPGLEPFGVTRDRIDNVLSRYNCSGDSFSIISGLLDNRSFIDCVFLGQQIEDTTISVEFLRKVLDSIVRPYVVCEMDPEYENINYWEFSPVEGRVHRNPEWVRWRSRGIKRVCSLILDKADRFYDAVIEGTIARCQVRKWHSNLCPDSRERYFHVLQPWGDDDHWLIAPYGNGSDFYNHLCFATEEYGGPWNVIYAQLACSLPSAALLENSELIAYSDDKVNEYAVRLYWNGVNGDPLPRDLIEARGPYPSEGNDKESLRKFKDKCADITYVSRMLLSR